MQRTYFMMRLTYTKNSGILNSGNISAGYFTIWVYRNGDFCAKKACKHLKRLSKTYKLAQGGRILPWKSYNTKPLSWITQCKHEVVLTSTTN